jgi:phage-related minor tail protein
MAEIAQASLRGLFSAGGSGGGIGAGLINGLSSLVAGLVGVPGRATGGPVSAGRSYLVGERGPELFVPSSQGRVERLSSGGRDVRVSIAVQAPVPSDPQALRQSSRQVARAVRSALAERR